MVCSAAGGRRNHLTNDEKRSFGWPRQPIVKIPTGPLMWIKSGFDKFRQLKSDEDK